MYRIITVSVIIAILLALTMYVSDAESTNLIVNVSLSKEYASYGDVVDVTVLISGNEQKNINGLGIVEISVPFNTDIFSYVKDSEKNLIQFDQNADPVVTLGYRVNKKDVYYSYVDVINPIKKDTELFTFQLSVISDSVNISEVFTAENIIISDKDMNTINYSKNSDKLFITSFNIDDEKLLISKICKNTKVKDFKEKFLDEFSVEFLNNGHAVDDSTYIGTGMKVKFYLGSEVLNEYETVVTGDVNGDGNINVTDMILVSAHILKKRELTGINLYAADTYKDGTINVTDYIRVLSDILGKRAIEPY